MALSVQALMQGSVCVDSVGVGRKSIHRSASNIIHIAQYVFYMQPLARQ